MANYHFWLRDEVKPLEYRTPLLPGQVKILIENGHTVTVERSEGRCFPDNQYEENGATLVESGSWKNAPLDAIIFGLKELPEEDTPLVHTHIFFAHCYKYQGGWKEFMNRFIEGKGTIYDLEFLKHENGRRVAAFGHSAGYVGAAIGTLAWIQQNVNKEEKLSSFNEPFGSFNELSNHVSEKMEAIKSDKSEWPRIIIIGALGRCGTGATDCANDIGFPEENIIKWDLEETKDGGPFPQILENDILINCIYLTQPIEPFITLDMLNDSKDSRNLSVVVDISCDTTNPNNPIPIYDINTTFKEPTIRIIEAEDNNNKSHNGIVDVVSIDHLPSLVPSDSSVEFANALFEHILNFKSSDVWKNAEALFIEKSEESKN
eukprot:TRINITY_DN902_c0_g1_i1.p1 TRINITY_DN902_c0_g1~~TRINITY_DN902_c0_g1_i1.p1  ORF type:complete len:375 (-),score=152.90 TRINITY_DN902_c0_g1_i1:143-1267(-)